MSSSAIEPTGRPTPSTPRDQAERSSPGHGSSVNDDEPMIPQESPEQSEDRRSRSGLRKSRVSSWMMMRNGECRIVVAFLIGVLVGGEGLSHLLLL